MSGKPLQIYLRPDQDQALRSLAAKEHTSIAEIIRRSVDVYLAGKPPEEDPALGLVSLGRSGRGDLSVRHDEAVARGARR